MSFINTIYYYFYPRKPVNKTVIRQTLLVSLFFFNCKVRFQSNLLEKEKIIDAKSSIVMCFENGIGFYKPTG